MMENVYGNQYGVTMTFEEWCIANEKQDLLERWDYEKNWCKPSEIGFGSNTKIYFKCPEGLHESEEKTLFTISRGNKVVCSKCNSLANAIINNYGESYLRDHWSEKNNVSPWKIQRGSKKKVWLKCSLSKSHPDYEQIASVFVRGCGCPLCTSKATCKEDSLAVIYEEVIELWSNKNTKTPYEYTYRNNQEVWWKCPEGLHNDYLRRIDNSSLYGFRCPKCSREKAHRRVDLTGKKYSRLTVLGVDMDKSSLSSYWICKCECGNIKSVLGSHLTTGKIRSCGCLWQENISGANCHLWKGGITPKDRYERTTKEYRKWRKLVFIKDNYTCQCCGKTTGGSGLNVHHIHNYSKFQKERLDVSNGITLCQNCHDSTIPGSFHNLFGTHDNDEFQLEVYINYRRKELCINEEFRYIEYKNKKK